MRHAGNNFFSAIFLQTMENRLGLYGSVFSVFLLVGNCGIPKVVRVPLTPEKIQQSAQLVREGDQFFTRKEFYPALGKYVEAAKINPNNEYTFNKMGISYSALGFFGEAEQAVKRSLALNDKYFYAYNNLGTVYFAQGDLGKAIHYFRTAIKMAPKVASFYVNLGQVYLEKNDFPKAMEALRQAKKLDPAVMDKDSSLMIPSPRGKPNPEKSYSLARIFAASGDVEKTIKHLQDAIRYGFTHLEWVDSEPDFDAIRSNTDFALFYSEARLKYRAAP